MRKPALFRAIYAELRTSLGDSVSAKELVSIANHILRAYREETDGIDHGQAAVGRSMFSLPVDEAMEDGGWKVLEFEASGGDVDEVPVQLPISARLLVDKFLGPEWKNRIQRA